MTESADDQDSPTPTNHSSVPGFPLTMPLCSPAPIRATFEQDVSGASTSGLGDCTGERGEGRRPGDSKSWSSRVLTPEWVGYTDVPQGLGRTGAPVLGRVVGKGQTNWGGREGRERPTDRPMDSRF